MATMNSNTVAVSLTSSWYVKWIDPPYESGYYSITSGPSTATQDINFTVNLPAGAVVTGRTLYTSWTNPGAYQTWTVNGYSVGASTYALGVSNYSASYVFKAVGSTSSGAGNYSRTMTGSAWITVNYYIPTSGLSLNKTTMDAGQAVTSTIAPNSSAYTHKLTYTFGSKTSTKSLAAGVKTHAFTVPLDWLTVVPSATSGTMTVNLETLNGGTVIGTTSKTMTITVPAGVVPSLTGVTAELVANGVPADVTRYVQNYSKCKLTITGATGAYGSTISKYEITGSTFKGTASSSTFGPFPAAGSITFTGKVTDSRGRTASKTVSITVQAYAKPYLSDIQAFRCDEYGTADRRGGYVLLKATRVYSSIDGQNSATLKGRVYIKGGAPPIASDMSDATNKILGEGLLLPVKTYITEITVTDKLNAYTYSAEIPTDTVAQHFLDGVLGGAVGKYAETPGIFESAWPIVAPGMPPNPNILHNWDFRNPVNQRGATGTISATGYFYDRWILNSGSVTVAAGYLTMASGAVIEQRIEGLYLAGETVTVSVQTDAEIISGTGVFPTAAGTVDITLTGFGTATLGYNAGYMFARFTASGSQDVVAVKCELGTVSTLHLDPPMDYAVELPKCQRFFFKTEAYPQFMAYWTGTSLYGRFPTPVTMRISPSISVTDIRCYAISSSTVITLTAVTLQPEAIRLQATIASSQATSSGSAFFNVSGSGSVEFSADL